MTLGTLCIDISAAADWYLSLDLGSYPLDSKLSLIRPRCVYDCIAVRSSGVMVVKALERRLGLGGVFGLSVSVMLGPGAFIVPGVAIHGAGGLAWLTYIVAALIILPTAFAKSELASAMPRSGGAYVFITQAFGPAAGSVMGTGLWLSLVLKSAFALAGLGAYLALVSDLDLRLVALGMLAIMTALNLRGIDKVSKAQSAIVWFSVVALSVLLGVAIPSADPQMLPPLAPNGVSGFFETVALVFVAYAGVTKVAAIAGEVQTPVATCLAVFSGRWVLSRRSMLPLSY